MRTLALVFALLAASLPAWGQADKVVTGTFATTGSSMSITLEGRQGVSVMADGTCTGLSFAPQVSTNGTIWANTRMYDVANGTVVTSGGEGTFIIMGVGGMHQARLNITVLTATCDFTMRATVASGLPANVASAGVAVTSFPDNEPVNVAQMNGVAVTMGSGLTGTGVQRVVLATDVGLPASTNRIGALAVPVCDGTAINISATTTEADGTTVDATLYLMSVTGATAHCIWGLTATTTTGFQVPEGAIFYTTSEGTNMSCVTVAGTATVRLVPCDYDGS